VSVIIPPRRFALLRTPPKVGLAIVLAALLAAGCAGRQREPDSLADSIRSFNDGVRWERYSVAATRIPARERSQFVEDMDLRSDDMKITDYEIVNVDARGPREARVLLKMSWYRPSDNTVRETHAVQTWEKQGRAWMMVAEARQRGAEMPGLPEPPAP
jgi:ribosomal protein S16